MREPEQALWAEVLEKAAALRRGLHACPELSGQEKKTRALLQDFLRENTALSLHDCGGGFYAAFRGGEPGAPGIALRADYDALPLPQGGAAHLCGHDGHAATLCGVALLLEALRPRQNVFLLFQPAEETGAGAPGCLELFDREHVGEIYGAHNLPGFPFGTVTTREGTFACASLGLTLVLRGVATHAAYPELGRSPAGALGALLQELPALAPPGEDGKIRLCTVIGARLGEKAFGMAASEAELWLTLRAQEDGDLQAMLERITARAESLAGEAGLRLERELQDRFPATVNDPDCVRRVLESCGGRVLETPMRWSEDFGHYRSRCRGAFFGIGAGEQQPPLHNDRYEYPDALLAPSIRAFWNILAIEE